MGRWQNDPILVPGRICDESRSVQDNTHVSMLAKITAGFRIIDKLKPVLLQFMQETRKDKIAPATSFLDTERLTVVEEWANDLAIDSQ
jgi:hypothetical protein